jgi:hypothetical protein
MEQKQFTVGQERLRELYAMLAGVPDERFHLHSWREGGLSNEVLLSEGCGTAACAVGWACAYPPFKAQGLSFDRAWPTFEHRAGWDAVMAFFELRVHQAERLFMWRNYGFTEANTNARVRRRILEVLNEEGAMTKEQVLQVIARDGLENVQP